MILLGIVSVIIPPTEQYTLGVTFIYHVWLWSMWLIIILTTTIYFLWGSIICVTYSELISIKQENRWTLLNTHNIIHGYSNNSTTIIQQMFKYTGIELGRQIFYILKVHLYRTRHIDYICSKYTCVALGRHIDFLYVLSESVDRQHSIYFYMF